MTPLGWLGRKTSTQTKLFLQFDLICYMTSSEKKFYLTPNPSLPCSEKCKLLLLRLIPPPTISIWWLWDGRPLVSVTLLEISLCIILNSMHKNFCRMGYLTPNPSPPCSEKCNCYSYAQLRWVSNILEIDHEIFSMILLSLPDSRRAVVCFWRNTG